MRIGVVTLGRFPSSLLRQVIVEMEDHGRCIDFANLTFQSAFKDCKLLYPFHCFTHLSTHPSIPQCMASTDGRTGPFKNLSWKRSKVRLEMVAMDINDVLQTEWDEFFVHKRLMAVHATPPHYATLIALPSCYHHDQ
jgi:hypothetical protein